MLMQMRVYQICNRHRLGKQGSASALLFVPWLWEREIKMGFSAAQRDGRREAETAGCTYANCQGKTWSAALGSAALFLLDSGDMPPVTVGDSGICSWFGFESCERCYREISVWLISGQRRRFFFFNSDCIILFVLFHIFTLRSANSWWWEMFGCPHHFRQVQFPPLQGPQWGVKDHVWFQKIQSKNQICWIDFSSVHPFLH